MQDHGDFVLQKAKFHLEGTGCDKCSTILQRRAGKRRAQETIKKFSATFVGDSEAVHRDVYLYPNTNYTGTKHKLAVECRVHGEFWQLPRMHLSGQGCPKCAKGVRDMRNSVSRAEIIKNAAATFSQKSVGVHGFRYDYSKVVYLAAAKKVEIVCHKHGPFWQIPNSHLGGRGCVKCVKNGFKPQIPAEIYIYQSYIGEQSVILYGITNDFDVRGKAHKTTFKKHGVYPKLMGTYKCSGYTAAAIEREIKSSTTLYKNPMSGFKTECTPADNLNIVQGILKRYKLLP